MVKYARKARASSTNIVSIKKATTSALRSHYSILKLKSEDQAIIFIETGALTLAIFVHLIYWVTLGLGTELDIPVF